MTWYASPNRERFTGGPGWLASAYPGGGILGSAVPATGSNGHASPIYNDLVLPADANDEFGWAIVTAPASGTFIPYEDGSFYYLGPSTTFTYQLYENYIAIGSPATVTITVATSFTGSSAVEDLSAAGSFVAAGASVSFTGAAVVEALNATGSFIASAGEAVSFTGSAAVSDISATGSFFVSGSYNVSMRYYISNSRTNLFISSSRTRTFITPRRGN